MTIDAASGASAFDSLLASSNAATAGALSKLKNDVTTSAKASGTTKENKDTFMKLLVAQLRYQDPSKPVDSSQFIAQTAQFSTLETLEEMSTNNTSMLAAQLKLQASTLVGQTVSYPGGDGKTVTGVVSSASFTATSAGGTGGEPVLKVDGKDVLLSKISSIDVPGAAAAATGTATGTAGSTP